MNDINLIRNILLRIESLKIGNPILIEDLAKEFNLSTDEALSIISKLAVTFFVKLEGKNYFESYNIEKYTKIVGLDREGIGAVSAIKSDKIWKKTEEYLKEYDFSIFTAIDFSKKIEERELNKILDSEK